MQWETLNEDALLTTGQAARWFTRARGTRVTQQTTQGWVARYALPVADRYGERRVARYRLGDFLIGEKRSRLNDCGAGRGRPKAA